MSQTEVGQKSRFSENTREASQHRDVTEQHRKQVPESHGDITAPVDCEYAELDCGSDCMEMKIEEMQLEVKVAPEEDDEKRDTVEDLSASSPLWSSGATPSVGIPLNNRLKGRLSRSRKDDNTQSISDRSHPEFELTCDMMLGIRHAVGSSGGTETSVCDKDFKDVRSYRFPAEGSQSTPGHSMRSFKFKDYQPEVYRSLRTHFGIDTADYLLCLCGDGHYLEFISNSKSGQFFFYSHDRQFMIKTLAREEAKFLQQILPKYYRYVIRNPDTLLTRFYGMHRVKPHKGRKMHFVIMASVFYTDRFIHEVYDIKGSTQGRRASDKEREQETPVLKDLDFIDNKMAISIGPLKGLKLLQQVQDDVKFLQQLDIMDYSLLLGINYPDKEDSVNICVNVKEKSHRRRQSNYGLKTWQQVVSSSNVRFDADPPVREPSDRDSVTSTSHGNLIRNSNFDVPPKPSTSMFCSDSGGCREQCDGKLANRTYFFGIIDILQQYNMAKRIEHRWKSVKFDKNSISAVPPKVYANRFVEFLIRAIDTEPAEVPASVPDS